MKHIIVSIAAAVAVNFGISAQKVAQPDFAYPKTVSKNAIKELDSSLSAGNINGSMRALIDYTIASQMIGADNLPSVISKIDSARSVLSKPVMRSLTYLLEAKIYRDIYNSNRWIYDKRNLPLTPLPGNCKEWSGQQFGMRITQLVDSALLDSDVLKSARLSDYKKIITQNAMTAVYYPSVYDFVANSAIDMIESLSGGRRRFIPYANVQSTLSASPTYVPPTLIGDPLGEKVLSLYTSLISPASPYSAPSITAMIGRLRFLLANSVNPETGNSLDYTGAYLELYKSLCNNEGRPFSEYVGDILIDIPRDSSLYGISKQFLQYYPDYWRADCISNIISDLSSKSLTVSTPTLVPIGRSVTFNVSITNARKGTIDIYDVSSLPIYENEVNLRKNQPVPGKKIATIPVLAESTSFPFDENLTVTYIFPKAGNYIAVPRLEGVENNYHSYTKIHASGVVLTPSRFISRDIWAMDPADGSPLQNVDIQFLKRPYKTSQLKNLGKTDKDGKISVPGLTNGLVLATSGNDRFTVPVYSYNYEAPVPTRWTPFVEGYSSLPLYHPGDTAQWCAVCMESKGGLRRLMAGKELQAVLFDANSMPVDTVNGFTDDFGRITGSFTLPDGGLTGRYRVSLAGIGDAISFEVSDYKLPTFSLENLYAENGMPAAGEVTLHGRAVTYSGFPLSDAGITIDLSVMTGPVWWRQYSPFQFYTANVSTGNDGEFSFRITKDILALSPIPDGFYKAELTATSSTGESQTASISFTLGEKYVIKDYTPNNIDIAGGKVHLDVKVVDYRDSIMSIPVHISISDKDKSIKSFTLDSVADLTGIRPGRYTMAYFLEGQALADTVKREVILYNPTDTVTPVPGTLFWTPDSKLSVNSSSKARLLYATDADSHILLSLTCGDSLIRTWWQKAPAGIGYIEILMPEKAEKGRLELLCTGDYRQHSQSFLIERKNHANSLKFVTETFRDRISPGNKETWKFRITDNNGEGKEAAVITDLYNTALDAIAPSDWTFNTPSTYYRSWSWGSMPLTLETFSSIRQFGRNRSCPGLTIPAFETFGHSFSSNWNDGIRIRGRAYGAVLMKSSAKSESASADGESDTMVEEEMAVADFTSMDMASAPTASNDAGGMLQMDEAEGSTDKKASFQYRKNEIPLAFFRPSLTTDKDGRLSLTFTVPDANTRWGFRAIAFTDSLISAGFSANVIASKAVMVQPNLPRFLRTGDTSIIRASVMNNSDIDRIVDTTVEIFNPSDNSTIESITHTDTVPAGSSVIVPVEIKVPSGLAFLGYRVKSDAGENIDGEQALIPVLSTITPVIETSTFFMGPDEHEFATTLPSLPSGGKLSLTFCENPTWYVVTALPGLLEKNADTAPEAALSLYSAAIASGLLRDNPEIVKALKAWSESDKSDGTLTSMLDRNESLKILLLNSTPWMTEAADDNERMTRLSLLFNENLVRSTISSNIATLKSLESSDGGWRWCKQSTEPSQWATYRVLSMIGKLTELGFCPDDRTLAEMVNRALEWDNRETARLFARYPKNDYTSYVRIHDMFRSTAGAPSPLRRVIDTTTQNILKAWRNASLPLKAEYARILYNNNYPSVSRRILASIREFASYDPAKGMWFPTLDNQWFDGLDKVGITSGIMSCFHLIDPDCPEISQMCQWLILQKGAQNWGNGSVAASAVSSILTTSGKWTTISKGTSLSAGGHEIKSDAADRFTGEIHTLLPSSSYGKELRIYRNGSTPSWGAIFSQFETEMSDIKSASCPELSITKDVYVIGSGDNGKPQPARAEDKYSLGSKVRVTLTLKVDTDMDYVAITDERPACFEPVDQLSGTIYCDGLRFYRENRDSSTRIFIDRLPKGTYILTYDMWANNEGSYTSGIATIQSQYAPQYTAHSAGSMIRVE